MRDLIDRAWKWLERAGQRFRKLGRWERAALLVLGCIVGVAILLQVAGDGGGYRAVLSAEGAAGATKLQRLASALEEQGIPWRESSVDGAGVAIEVREGADHRRALAVLSREGLASPHEEGREEGFGSGIFETPEKFEARLREANRRKVEQALQWNPNIQSATIVLSHSRRPVFADSRDTGDSAAVLLHLRRGVNTLSREEAQAVREVVQSALNLRSERVTVSDDRFHRYEAPAADGEGSRAEEKEEQLRGQIREDIRKMYALTFPEDAFYVAVLVAVSRQRSSIEKKEMDRDKSFHLETSSETEHGALPGGILEPGASIATIRESTTSVPFDSYEKTRIEIPAGELKGVSVTVAFDLAAVERLEAATRVPASGDSFDAVPTALPGADRVAMVRDFVTRQEGVLRSALRLAGSVSATVIVQPFARMMEPAASSQIAAGTREEPPTAAAASPAWLERWWRPVLAAAALAASLLVFYRAVKSGARAPAFRRGGLEWAGPRAGVDGAAAERMDARAIAERGGAQDALILGSVGDASVIVRERPEVAASVLRLWLAQDAAESPEEEREGARA